MTPPPVLAGSKETSSFSHPIPDTQAVDDAGGVLYSRLTTTFIGFMLIALSNLLVCAGDIGKTTWVSYSGKHGWLMPPTLPYLQGFLSLDCFTTICNRKPPACGAVSKAAATEAPPASEVLATAA